MSNSASTFDFVHQMRSAKLLALEAGRRNVVEEIARSLGKTPAAVRHYFNGRRSPDINDIPAIAKALGVTVAWLFAERADVEQTIAPNLVSFLEAPDAVHKIAMNTIAALGRTPEAMGLIGDLLIEWERNKGSDRDCS